MVILGSDQTEKSGAAGSGVKAPFNTLDEITSGDEAGPLPQRSDCTRSHEQGKSGNFSCDVSRKNILIKIMDPLSFIFYFY